MTVLPAPWWLLATTAALNVPLGRLRAGAPPRSQRRFGVLAASVLLLFALRHAFGVAWADALPLVAAMLLGQYLGRQRRAPAEPSPLRWRVAAYSVLAAGLLLLAADPARAQAANDWKRLDADEAAPAFALTDQNGQSVALADLRGRALVLTFLFTECTDVCPVLPVMLNRVDGQLTAAEKKRTRFVGISIDPRRDTPERLRAFMRERGLDEGRWTLLTGSTAALTQVAADYGVVVRPDPRLGFVHNTVFILIDERGREKVEFHGLATPTPELVKALRQVLAGRTAKR